MESPSNCWTIAEARIADAVARSAAFQSLTETSDATAAAAYVFGEKVGEPVDGHAFTKDELAQLKHYAQVYSAHDHPYGVSYGANRPTPYGSAVVYVERLVTEAEQHSGEQPDDSERLFKNRIGDLMDEIHAWLGGAAAEDGLYIRRIHVTDGPGLNPSDRWKSQGMWQGCELTVDWGLVSE